MTAPWIKFPENSSLYWTNGTTPDSQGRLLTADEASRVGLRRKPVKCGYCEKGFASLVELGTHLFQYHSRRRAQ